MPTAALWVRCGGFLVRRRALPSSRVLFHSAATTILSSSRFDPDGSGCPTMWDTFGIWDDRIEESILLPPSIKYGKPIPKVSLSKVGCASLIGRRKENEDRLRIFQMTDSILYFAVFDGHGGSQAADFCHKYMERYIKDLVAKEENLELVLTKAFLEIDKALASHVHFSADEYFQRVCRLLLCDSGVSFPFP